MGQLEVILYPRWQLNEASFAHLIDCFEAKVESVHLSRGSHSVGREGIKLRDVSEFSALAVVLVGNIIADNIT